MNESTKPLPAGKLPRELLADLIGELNIDEASVVFGPGIGRDVAILDCGGSQYLVVTSDPITFATDALGYYAVWVNANDIATTGGIPRWMTVTLLLPKGAANENTVRHIWDQLRQAATDLEVVIIGGHTEITSTVTTPIVSGHMLGVVPREGYITSAGAVPGDEVVVLGQVPVEGTALLAREIPRKLSALGFAEDAIAAAAELLFDPGICVVEYARLAAQTCTEIHAFHDPTEGGLATGLGELALASKVGLRVEGDSIPVLGVGRDFCEKLGIDPLGLIASGCLLAALPAEQAQQLLAQAAEQHIPAAVIATVVPESEGLQIHHAGRWHPLPRYDQDELTKVL